MSGRVVGIRRGHIISNKILKGLESIPYHSWFLFIFLTSGISMKHYEAVLSTVKLGQGPLRTKQDQDGHSLGLSPAAQ